ncbi:hypothetical protein SESBI_11608 [Sesbania bispinosa]|nr:hypothetical protein SESBI_11608 [Sesbania bispinosa]
MVHLRKKGKTKIRVGFPWRFSPLHCCLGNHHGEARLYSVLDQVEGTILVMFQCWVDIKKASQEELHNIAMDRKVTRVK